MKTIKERYGHYTLDIDYRENDYAQVTVHDLGNIQWPLVASIPMTYEQANSYLQIFKQIGYIAVA